MAIAISSDPKKYNNDPNGQDEDDTRSSSIPKGLIIAMNDMPCVNSTNKECCENSKCATFASGHLSSQNTFLYGHFNWNSVRTGHSSDDNNSPDGPENELSCLGCYVDTPTHNEISFCIHHDATRVHIGYWFNDTAHKSKYVDVPSDIGELSESWNDFSYHWNSDEILFELGTYTLWHVTKEDSEIGIPYLPCALKFILRPQNNETYLGPSYLFVESFQWTSED